MLKKESLLTFFCSKTLEMLSALTFFFARENLVLEKVTENDCSRGESKSDKKLTQGVRSGGEAPTPIFWVKSFLKDPIQ